MIRDDIKAATIAAMKSGDRETVGTLRLAQAAIKNRDIEARTGGAPKDDDSLVTEVLQKMVKQRRESADIYRKNGREDRAAIEESEIAAIERFLPRQLSDAEADAQIGAIVPPRRSFTSAITRPMSFIDEAPVSATIAWIAAVASASLSCRGRKRSITAISASSIAARSSRPFWR